MIMESRIEASDEGIYGIRDELLIKLKVESKKFLDCDAMIANLIYDPRIDWKFDGPVFNSVLFKKGFVSYKQIILFVLMGSY